MKGIFSLFSIIILNIFRSHLTLDYYCSSQSADGKNCSNCLQGFSVDGPTGLCVSNCLNGLYLEIETQKCVSSCNYNEIGDSTQKVCKDIYQCPILVEVGQDFHSGPATSIILDNRSQDLRERIMVTVSDSDINIKLWNLMTGELKATFSGHTQPILKVFLLEDSNELLSFSSNGEIFYWNFLTGQLNQKQTITLGQLTSLSSVQIEQGRITLYGFQGEFFIYNYKTKVNTKYIGHTNIVLKAIFIGLNQIITYSLDKSIILWNLSASPYTFNTLCKHDSTPGGIAILNFTIETSVYSFLFSYGSSGSDSQKIYITNLQSAQGQCLNSLSGDFTQSIINIIVDENSYSILAFSSEEIIIYGYNISKNSFIMLQLLNQSFFSFQSFLPIKGVYIYQVFIVVYTSTGKFTVTNYQNQNKSQQSLTQSQQIIQITGLNIIQLSRKDIRGVNIDISNGLLYLYGQQILQINMLTQKVNYVINNLVQPYIRNTQKIPRAVISSAQNIIATTSNDGLSMSYDYLTGKLIQIFFHPDYTQSSSQPQGVIQALVQGILLCVAYNDKSVVCYHAVNGQVFYKFTFMQDILRVFNEDTNGYLLVNSLDYLQIVDPFNQKVINTKQMNGQFYYMNFYQNFNCMTTSITGNIIRWNYPDFTIKYQKDTSDINTTNAQIVGFAFETAQEGYSIFYFKNGLAILFDQTLNVIQNTNDNLQINRCGIVKPLYYYTCLNQDGSVIAHGYSVNGSFYFKKQVFSFPITDADVVPKFNKAMFVIDLGSYGGSLVFADAATLTGESQFLSPASITRYYIDEDNQRVYIPNVNGDLIVSHFNPSTNTKIARAETSIIKKLLLIKSEQKVVILSNIITIYDYFAKTIYKTNNKVHTSSILNALVIEDLKLIISFNFDIQNNLQVWNYSKDQSQALVGHSQGVNGVQFIKQQNLILSYDNGGMIKIWSYNEDLSKISIPLDIKQHSTNSIISVQIFNKYNTYFISFDSAGNVFITNYLDGNIMKAFTVQSMNQMIVDYENDRIFLYGVNIAVYSAITGTKISDLIGFDNIVQNVIFKNNYIIAYGSVLIQSIQRDSLTVLFQSKFKKTIYSLSVLKNLVGMVGNNVDNSVEIWDYTNGVMLSEIKNVLYPSNLVGILQDEEADFFIIHNIDRQLFTIIPFSDSYNQVKDFLFTQVSSSFIKDYVFDNASNKLIVCNDDQINVWNYYTYLGLQGQATILPSDSLIMSTYHTQKDIVAYADLEHNVWEIKNNLLSYKIQLSYSIIQLKLHTNTYLTSDGVYLYSYNIEFQQISKLQIYPYQIYINEQTPYVFVQTYGYEIIQLQLDPVTSQLSPPIKIYKDHSNRIIDCIFNFQYSHIITYDVSGFFAINNFIKLKSISIPQYHSKIIRDILIDFKNKRLISLSQDKTSIIFSYDGDNTLVVVKVIQQSSSVIQGLIDSIRDEILIWIDLQQGIQVRDLTTFNLKKQIYGPGDYLQKMKLSNQYNILAIFNPFQVNLHDRSSNDVIINSLRVPSSLYDIQEIEFLSASLFLIKSRTQLKLIRFSASSITIEKTFSMNFPYLLALNYENQLMMKIKGVNLNKVFNYTFPFANDPDKVSYSQCYSNLERTATYFQLYQDLNIQSSSFLKISQSINRIVLNIQMDDAQNFFFVKQSSSSFANSNKVEQLFIYNRKQQSTSDRMKLKFTSLEQFDMETLTLKNFEWKIVDMQIYQFNQNTQNILFVDSIFSDDIIGTQFIIDSINRLQVDKISISNLRMVKYQAKQVRRILDNIQSNVISLFKVSNSAFVYINELTISNVSIQNSFTLFEFIKIEQVVIQNLVIDNVNYFHEQGTQESWSSLFSIQNCNSVIIKSVTIKNCIKFSDQGNVQAVKLSYSKFIVFQMKANKIITINKLTAYKNEYLMIFDISQQYLQEDIGYFKVINDVVSFTELIVSDSTNVPGFAVNQIGSDNLFVKDSNFDNVKCTNSFGCAFDISQTTFTFNNCNFSNLSALNGGSISIRDSPFSSLITKSKFISNSASQGGAIFLDSSNIQITESIIQSNSAKVGGAIRYLNLIPDLVIQKQYVEGNQFNNIFVGNQAEVYGQNVGSYPRSIKLISNENSEFKLINGNSNMGLSYTLDNFMSGGTISFDVTLYDEDQGIVNIEQLQKLNDQLKEELNGYTLECSSYTSDIQITGSKAIFNSTNKSFTFTDILIKAKPSTKQAFYINNNMIQVPDSTDSSKFLAVPKYIKIEVEFRLCQVGEIYVQSILDTPAYCSKCPDQKYSLVLPDPNSKEEQVCKLCPEECFKCEGNEMILKNGYWRSSNLTDVLVSCFNSPDNCQGESKDSINYCKEGYVGPLCESCDIEGKVWNHKYMNSEIYKCIPCQDSQSLVFMYLISVLVGCIYLTFGIRSALIVTRIKVQGYYLRMLGLASIGNSDSTDQSDIYLKFLMHFIQISSIVYQIQLPSFLFMFQVSIGTPIDSLKYSQDCRSVFAASYIPPVYGRLLWSQLIPLGYVGIFLGSYYALHLVNKIQKIDKKLITTGAIFMFLFMQPNIISGLVSVISCREIAGNYYITADVTLECYSEEYYKFNGILFLPFFLIWAVIIPLIWIISLAKKRTKLNYCTVRLSYGFLYQEYKPSQYYWEFIKINLKLIIIFVSTFFNQQISVQSTLCTLVIFGYLIMSLFKAPYTCVKFNHTDQYMCIVLIACLQLNIFIKTTDNSVLASIGSFVLFFINYLFIFYLFLQVIQGKLKRYLLIFGKKFPVLRYKCSGLYKRLGISQVNKMNTYRNWSRAIKLIGEYLNQKEFEKNQTSPTKTERKSIYYNQKQKQQQISERFFNRQKDKFKQLSRNDLNKFTLSLAIAENGRRREDSQFTLVKSEQESQSPDIIRKYTSQSQTDENELISIYSPNTQRRTSRTDLELCYQFKAKSNNQQITLQNDTLQ